MKNSFETVYYKNQPIRVVQPRLFPFVPLLSLKDVCKAIGIKNPTCLNHKAELGVDRWDVSPEGGGRQVVFVTQKGLLFALSGSRKPGSKDIKEWISAPSQWSDAPTHPENQQQLLFSEKKIEDVTVVIRPEAESDNFQLQPVVSRGAMVVSQETELSTYVEQNSVERDQDTVTEYFDGHPVEFRQSDGYMNLTALCREFNRIPNDFLRLSTTQDMIGALASDLGEIRENLVFTSRGVGRDSGTWIHPEMAIEAARWVKPVFSIQCNRIIARLMAMHNSTPEPREAPLRIPTTTEALRALAEYSEKLDCEREKFKESEQERLRLSDVVKEVILEVENEKAYTGRVMGVAKQVVKEKDEEISDLKYRLESITGVEDHYEVAEVAKRIGTNGPLLFQYLREKGLVFKKNKKNHLVQQRAANNDWLTVRIDEYKDPKTGELKTSKTIRITPMGWEYLHGAIRKDGRKYLDDRAIREDLLGSNEYKVPDGIREAARITREISRKMQADIASSRQGKDDDLPPQSSRPAPNQ